MVFSRGVKKKTSHKALFVKLLPSHQVTELSDYFSVMFPSVISLGGHKWDARVHFFKKFVSLFFSKKFIFC